MKLEFTEDEFLPFTARSRPDLCKALAKYCNARLAEMRFGGDVIRSCRVVGDFS